jgi:hypothetical protein
MFELFFYNFRRSASLGFLIEKISKEVAVINSYESSQAISYQAV